MSGVWPAHTADLADRLVADAVGVLEGLAAGPAPGLELPRTFGGHPVGPDVAADLAFTCGLLIEHGVDAVAGVELAPAVWSHLRAIDGPGTHTFYSYRVAETVARLGGLVDNPVLAGWSAAERDNLIEACDSSSFEAALDDGLLPNNYAVVLARCEQARKRLGLLDDERFLDKALDRTRGLLDQARQGWIDDSGDGRGQVDIYTPDMFLFSEPLAGELGETWTDGLRRVLADAAALAQPGGAVVWGRSVGALGLALSIELGAVAVGRELTDDPGGWGARAAHAAAALSGWFVDGVLASHVDRSTMFYRGPERRLQMTLDITGKLMQAVHELRRRPDVEVGPVAAAFTPVDAVIDLGGERPVGVWTHRDRHLRCLVPAVGGVMGVYRPSVFATGLWEPPTQGPIAFGPVVHGPGGPRAFQGAPARLSAEPGGGASVEWDLLGTEGQAEPVDDAPSGRRTTRFAVEGRSLVVEDRVELDHPEQTDAVAWALPQRTDRPFTVEVDGLDDTQAPEVTTADVSGVAEWRSFWGTATRVHEFSVAPDRRVGVRWTMTPHIVVGGTAGRHHYPMSLFTPVADRVHHVDAPIDDPVAVHGIDVLHLHWPEWYSGTDPDRTREVIEQLRQADTPVLWTMHNLVPHYFRGDDAEECYRLWARAADAVIHHTAWGRDLALATYDYGADTEHAVIPHGHWGERLGPLADRDEAAALLGLDPAEIRIGIIGAPRVDKKTQRIIDGVHRCGRDDVQLVVYSATDEDIPDDPRIVAHRHEHVSEEVYRLRLAALDAIALPFETAGSGMLMTGTVFDAIGGGRAALCSDWPVLAEVLGDAGLYYGNSSGDLARFLDDLDRSTVEGAGRAAAALAPRYDWEAIAEDTVALIERMLG